MSEIIQRIHEVHDVEQKTLGTGGGFVNLLGALVGYSKYDGYAIETDAQTIYVLIDNGQSCCEEWGYLASDDDLSVYKDAELRSIAVVDEGLNTIMVERGQDLDEGAIVFVNFNTDRGVFQLACYNSHNGYYGHEVHLISQQMTKAFGV